MENLKYIAVILLSLWYSTIFSQLQQPNNATLQDLSFFVNVNNPEYANAEGSKYIFEDFKLARIDNFQGTHLIRFNVMDNVIELKKGENEILNLSKKYRYKITLQDGAKEFETHEFKSPEGINETTFFEKVHTGEAYSLYLRHRIDFVKAKQAKSSYEPAKPAKFVRLESTYYLMDHVTNPEHLIEVPNKKKFLPQFFGEKAKEIGRYMKDNNLKMKSKEELILVLDRYFGLMK